MRSYNFSAGPATLPQAVLEQVQAECLDWQDGMSVMEVSHRSSAFIELANSIEQRLRQLMHIPENYRVLFMQGGASQQFAMVPLNLLRDKTTADYMMTGAWSKKAVKEARRYCDVNLAMNTEDSGFTTLQDQSAWQLNSQAAFCHYTPNETIHGVEFHQIPETGVVPLVADMSSMILSRPIDVSRFALIYAGAQKNMGPAGITTVIIREDLLDGAAKNCPGILNYQNHAASDSMYNTPPTFIWYVLGLVLHWLEQQGGVDEMAKRNQEKSELLYQTIDETAFYHNAVAPAHRSWMNIPFTLHDATLDERFLQQAESHGLMSLVGHRSTGGMRASIYNAMPLSGVKALSEFMVDFANNYG